jgi:predicted O-methyltransferase YrrM
MKNIILQLFKIFKDNNYTILSNYGTWRLARTNNIKFMGTNLLNNSTKQLVTNGYYGISLNEVMFLSNLPNYHKFNNILIIGNSFGFSTILFKIMYPDANIIAIDPIKYGNDITREIILNSSLTNIYIEDWKSPEDLKQISIKYKIDKFDLVFIDAIHDNKHLLIDYNESKKIMNNEQCCLILHDVILFNMIESFNIIKKDFKTSFLLTKTETGIGLLVNGIFSDDFLNYNDCFSDNLSLLDNYLNT